MEDLSPILGKTVSKVKVDTEDMKWFELHFDDGSWCEFYHMQDCCETVFIEDICGDLKDLVGSPILMAEEVIGDAAEPEKYNEYFDRSYTWTFYKFATMKGYVTMRWLGESNGYYGEEVDFRMHYPAELTHWE